MLMRLLFVLMMLVPMGAQAQAATLFSSTFEGSCAAILATSYAQSYTGFPCTGGPMTLTTSAPFAGSQSLRLHFIGVEEFGKAGGFADFKWSSRTTDLWLTFYTRMSTDFVTGGHPTYFGDGGRSNGTKGLYTFLYSNAKGQRNGWSMAYLYGGRQLVMGAQGIKDARNNSGQLVPYDSEWIRQNVQAIEQPLGVWVCYEVHIRLNTPGQANGLYEQWMTNMSSGGSAILQSRHPNREFLDSTTSGQMPSDAQWYEHKIFRQNGYGSMDYDNIQYTTTRVGCSGTPPPAETTPPPADTTPPPDAPSPVPAPIGKPGVPAFTVVARSTELEVSWPTVLNGAGAPALIDVRLGVPGQHWGLLVSQPCPASPCKLTGLTPATTYRVQAVAYRADPGGNVFGELSPAVDLATVAAEVQPPSPLVLIDPATVTMRGDQVFIACDPARYTKARTTGAGTKRTITCLK